jgi:hypothetical protein
VTEKYEFIDAEYATASGNAPGDAPTITQMYAGGSAERAGFGSYMPGTWPRMASWLVIAADGRAGVPRDQPRASTLVPSACA